MTALLGRHSPISVQSGVSRWLAASLPSARAVFESSRTSRRNGRSGCRRAVRLRVLRHLVRRRMHGFRRRAEGLQDRDGTPRARPREHRPNVLVSVRLRPRVRLMPAVPPAAHAFGGEADGAPTAISACFLRLRFGEERRILSCMWRPFSRLAEPCDSSCSLQDLRRGRTRRMDHRRPREGDGTRAALEVAARDLRRARQPPLPPDRGGRTPAERQAARRLQQSSRTGTRRTRMLALRSRTARVAEGTVELDEPVTTSFYGPRGRRPRGRRPVGRGAYRVRRPRPPARPAPRPGDRSTAAPPRLGPLHRLARGDARRRRDPRADRPASLPDAVRDRRRRRPRGGLLDRPHASASAMRRSRCGGTSAGASSPVDTRRQACGTCRPSTSSPSTETRSRRRSALPFGVWGKVSEPGRVGWATRSSPPRAVARVHPELAS